ncbi:MAG: response regulator [Bacteriovoracaceae bacterium]|jgi:CheY-like chemotaxis protein|nr:response regulator [Bacteriovoracaceae bacterium]
MNNKSFRTRNNFRILIVDDEIDHAEMIKKYIETGFSFDVVQVETDPQKALQLLMNKVQYELIFIDNIMPEIQGLEIIKFLRTQEENDKHKTKIILLSGSLDHDIVEEAILYSVTDILVKPVSVDKILKKVTETLKDWEV